METKSETVDEKVDKLMVGIKADFRALRFMGVYNWGYRCSQRPNLLGLRRQLDLAWALLQKEQVWRK